MMTTPWRYWYDVIVVLLTLLGALVALALLRPTNGPRTHALLRLMAWTAAGMLTLRGAAGMVVDRTADLVWWPLFLAGGLLFGAMAWESRPIRIPPSRGSEHPA